MDQTVEAGLSNGRAARLVDEAGVLVASGDTQIDDDDVFGLMDAGRLDQS